MLIGIVNAKIILEGVEGIGYAIPSNLACNVADNIIDNCYGKIYNTARRALLGITVTTSTSKAVYDPETGLVSIEQTVIVVEASSTCLFGKDIKADDIIKSVKLNGHEELTVTRQHHVIDYMLQARAGDTGTLTVSRLNEQTGEYEDIVLSFSISAQAIVNY